MTKFVTVDQPTAAPERRRRRYAPRKLDPLTDGVSLTEFATVIGLCLGALYLVAEIARALA